MRMVCAFAATLLLSACATPRPVMDTAALVAKMSTDMNRSVTNYVGSLKATRDLDSRRLQRYGAETDELEFALQERLQVLKLANEVRLLQTLSELSAALTPAPDPLRSMADVSVIAATPVSFDGTPLQSLARIASEFAKPRDGSEQLSVLLKFAKQVNGDLEKLAQDNKSVAP